MFLRQSTASQEIKLGPFLDDTDGKTAETALTIANTDIKLTKGGATTEVDKNSGGATHVASGRYSAVLDATDTDTVGILEIDVAVAGALPVRRQYYVLEEAVFDSLFAPAATNRVDANVTQAEGVAWSSGAITAAAIATGAITSAKFGSGAITSAVLAGGAITAGTFAANAISAGSIANNALDNKGNWLQPTVAGRTLDVSVGGEAGIDWANVGSPTTALNLSGTTISISQAVASVSGAVGSVTGNVGGNVVGSVASVVGGVTVTTNNDKTGYSLLANTGLGNQTANITGNLSGSVGSVVGGVTVSTNNDKTGYSLSTAPLDAAGTRAALGLAAANLDTQLSAIDLWTKRNAVLNTGTLTGSGTNTEVYTISSLGITATCTTDSNGNRSSIVWS